MTPPLKPPPSLPAQVIAAIEDARDSIEPALAAWVRTQLAFGRAPFDIVQQMVASGRRIEIATLLVGLSVKGLGIAPAGHAQAPSTSTTTDTRHAEQHAVEHGTASVRTLLSIGRGGVEIALYDGLITDSEIEHLKRIAAPRMARSGVLSTNFGTADSEVRTSEQTFLEVGFDPIVAGLEARISAITGIPVENGEGLQVLRYGVSQKYEPHFDFFDPANQQEHAVMAGNGGNRVGTMLLYLSDVERGGSTYFPKLDLAVHPRRGQALWFRYLHDGLLDERSQHAGMPILAGEKWLATKWFRERAFEQVTVREVALPT